MLSKQFIAATATFLLTILRNEAHNKKAEYGNFGTSDQYLEDVFENATDPGHYNRHVRPPSEGPTVVFTSLRILRINDISSQNMQLDVSLLISQKWSDLRLDYQNQTGNLTDESQCIEGAKWHLDRVWFPSLFVLNEQQGNLIDITDDNVYIRVCSRGELYFQYRIHEILHCSMGLSRFPFDSQRCKIELGSWRYSSNSVVLEWATDSNQIPNNIFAIKEFKLVNHTFSKEFRQDLGRGSHNYSVLVVDLYLERQWGYYLIQYYVTSFMLVFVSWISLWLDPAAAPARVTLGTSTLLTFVTLSSSSKAVLPKVSAVTVIDWWYSICMIAIVATLMEYALVNITYRRQSVVHMKKVAAKYIMKSALHSEPTTPRRLSVASKPHGAFTNPNYDYSEMNQLSIMSLPDLGKYHRNNFNEGQGNNNITDLNDLRKKQVDEANSMQKENKEKNHYIAQHNENPNEEDYENDYNVELRDENKEDAVASDTNPELKVRVPTLGRYEKPFYEMTYPEIALWIDTRSRIVFPLLFLIVTIIYTMVILIPDL